MPLGCIFLMLKGEVKKESEAIMQNVTRVVLNDVMGTAGPLDGCAQDGEDRRERW